MSTTPAAVTGALARLLADRAASASSGIVTAERGKLRRIFCLVQGHLAYAASNIIEEQFVEHLVRTGALSPAQRTAAVERSQDGGGKISRILLDSGVLSERSLRKSLEDQISELLASTLEWPDGSVEFHAGQPNLEGEITTRLHPAPLLLAHAQRFPPDLAAVRMGIGPPDVRPKHVAKRAAWLAEHNDPAVRSLLERCDGIASVPDLTASWPAGEEAALRTLYALTLLGAVAPLEVPTFRRATGDPPLGRDECMAVLGRADSADHYAVLGLTRQAPAEEVRRSYYALARRYHPDRFRSGALRDLLPRMERYFTKVTEAYNTLSNRELRAEYDSQHAAPTAEGEASRQTETSYLARQNYLRGKALMERKRWTEAATFLENAVRLDSSQAAYQLDLGLLLARNPRRRSESERALLRAAELDPANVAPYLALGQLYQRAGRLAHAARMFREVLRWEPDHAQASASLAEVSAAAASEPVDFLQPIFGG